MSNTRPSLAFRALARQAVTACEKAHADIIKVEGAATDPFIVKTFSEKLRGFAAAVKRLDHFDTLEANRSEFLLKEQTKDSYNIPDAKIAVEKLLFLRVDNTVQKKYEKQIADIHEKLKPADIGLWDVVAGIAKEVGAVLQDAPAEVDDKQKPKVVTQPAAKTKEQLRADLKAVITARDNEQKAFLFSVERECSDTLDRINLRIELQKRLFFSSISSQMMWECLSVYACLMDLQEANLENYRVIGVMDLQKVLQKFIVPMRDAFQVLWAPNIGSKSGIKIYELYKGLASDAKKIVLEGSGEAFMNGMAKIIPTISSTLTAVDLKTKLLDTIPQTLKASHPRSFVSWMYGETKAMVAPVVDFAPMLRVTEPPSPK